MKKAKKTAKASDAKRRKKSAIKDLSPRRGSVKGRSLRDSDLDTVTGGSTAPQTGAVRRSTIVQTYPAVEYDFNPKR